MNMKRVSKNYITKLEKDEIFVFGSNESGIHGAGAAKMAISFGAIYGKGIGMYGQTYAIPTKDNLLCVLHINKIKQYVDDFILFVQKEEHLNKKFMVTEIGCGLAGYKVEDIAPLFIKCLELDLKNVYLPERFINFLEK